MPVVSVLQVGSHARPLPIVGIGASAGGLEAFIQLLRHLPTTTGMAYVFIQHLVPTRESLLADLLSQVTTLPVSEVRDGMVVEPDHVYVTIPNRTVTLVHGRFALHPRVLTGGQHLAINAFLRSLAADRHRYAIGVRLSGTASDGTFGLAAIQQAHGMTFAPDAASAKYDTMPQSTVDAGNGRRRGKPLFQY